MFLELHRLVKTLHMRPMGPNTVAMQSLDIVHNNTVWPMIQILRQRNVKEILIHQIPPCHLMSTKISPSKQIVDHLLHCCWDRSDKSRPKRKCIASKEKRIQCWYRMLHPASVQNVPCRNLPSAKMHPSHFFGSPTLGRMTRGANKRTAECVSRHIVMGVESQQRQLAAEVNSGDRRLWGLAAAAIGGSGTCSNSVGRWLQWWQLATEEKERAQLKRAQLAKEQAQLERAQLADAPPVKHNGARIFATEGEPNRVLCTAISFGLCSV